MRKNTLLLCLLAFVHAAPLMRSLRRIPARLRSLAKATRLPDSSRVHLSTKGNRDAYVDEAIRTEGGVDGFCLNLALALGAFSFDVYNDPAVSKTSTGLDGTSLTFHSTDIISKLFTGVLLCTLRSGKFEAPEEREFAERLVSGKKIDPYVKFWLDESESNVGALRSMDSYTSKVKQDTESPVWNETFTLYVQSPSHANLHVNVSDMDTFSDDDDLGQGKLSLRRLLQNSKSGGNEKGNRMEVPIPLFVETGKDGWFSRKKKTKTGSIVVDVEYIPWKQSNTETSGGKGLEMRLPKGASPGLADWEQLLRDGLRISTTSSKMHDVNDRKDVDKYTDSNPSKSLIKSMKHKLHHTLSVENKGTDTQAAIWVDFESKNLIVTFRGTEQIKIRDILTDMNLLQSHYFPNSVKKKHKSSVSDEFATLVRSDILCHTGFMTAFRSVSPSLLQVLYSIFTKDEDDVPWHIHITGHSLGGALANLMNFELARLREGIFDDDDEHVVKISGDRQNGGESGDEYNENATLMDVLNNDKWNDIGKLLMGDETFSRKLKEAKLCAYTYGAPRVGNPAFSNFCDKYAPHHYRIINNRDVVPRVPRSTFANRILEYKHAGQAVVMINSSDTIDETRMKLWVEGESDGTSPIADVAPFTYKDAPPDSSLSQLEKALKPLIESIDEKGKDATGEGNFLKGLPNLLEVVGLGKDDMQQISDLYTTVRDISSGIDPLFMQRELELLDSILDSRAVEHHLEPSYFASIKDLFMSRLLLNEKGGTDVA